LVGEPIHHTEEPAMTEHVTNNDATEDELLSLAEAAALLRAPVATLRYWRYLGTGPRSFRVGRAVRYWHSDVVAWLHEQTIHSSSSDLDATPSTGRD
jgi:predicted DNA-binding transcriptional regulator AlpA